MEIAHSVCKYHSTILAIFLSPRRTVMRIQRQLSVKTLYLCVLLTNNNHDDPVQLPPSPNRNIEILELPFFCPREDFLTVQSSPLCSGHTLQLLRDARDLFYALEKESNTSTSKVLQFHK